MLNGSVVFFFHTSNEYSLAKVKMLAGGGNTYKHSLMSCINKAHIPLHIHYKGLHIFYKDPKRLNCFEVRPIVSCKQLPTFWKGISLNQLQVSSTEDAMTADNIIRFMDASVGCNDREKLGFSFKDRCVRGYPCQFLTGQSTRLCVCAN